MNMDSFFKRVSIAHRLRVGVYHFAFSAMIGLAAAIIVLGIWYPAPYRTLSGGLHLFSILMLVDIMLGPLATIVASGPNKSRSEWRRDVMIIVTIQLAALSYGLWIMYQARPVYVAFEIDRMRVVHAIDVPSKLLINAPESIRSLPLNGPGLIAIRSFHNENEKIEATMAALQGVELSYRPDLWIPYESARANILLASKPITELMDRKPETRTALTQAIKSTGLRDNIVPRYLPLHERSSFWTVLLDPTNAHPLAYLPIDPY
jgi:hypothetical protein